MSKWKDCEKEYPKRRKDNELLSETVLVYGGEFHSIAFYDYRIKQWNDITVRSYIEDMNGKWMYLPKPPKKLQITFK